MWLFLVCYLGMLFYNLSSFRYSSIHIIYIRSDSKNIIKAIKICLGSSDDDADDDRGGGRGGSHFTQHNVIWSVSHYETKCLSWHSLETKKSL